MLDFLSLGSATAPAATLGCQPAPGANTPFCDPPVAPLSGAGPAAQRSVWYPNGISCSVTSCRLGKVNDVFLHVTHEPSTRPALAGGSVVRDPSDGPVHLRRLDSARMSWTVMNVVRSQDREDQDRAALTDPSGTRGSRPGLGGPPAAFLNSG